MPENTYIGLCNISDGVIREIKEVWFYKQNALSYNAALNGHFPDQEGLLLRAKVFVLSKYKEQYKAIQASNNDCYQVQLKLPISNLFTPYQSRLSHFRGMKCVAVTISNYGISVLGNKREPLTLNFIPDVKNNGKGEDYFWLSVMGYTSLFPKIRVFMYNSDSEEIVLPGGEVINDSNFVHTFGDENVWGEKSFFDGIKTLHVNEIGDKGVTIEGVKIKDGTLDAGEF